jgi:Zn-dependent oligopeptidase
MSFCILPDSKALRSQLTNLRSQVQSYGPSLTLQIKGVSNSDSKKLFQLYKDDVDREYRELLEECKEFLDEIKNNLASGNVTQTEVSELEESLEGLERWFAKIKGRDSGRSQIRANIERVMRRCHSALLRFSEKAQPQTRLPGIHRLQRRLKTPR